MSREHPNVIDAFLMHDQGKSSVVYIINDNDKNYKHIYDVRTLKKVEYVSPNFTRIVSSIPVEFQAEKLILSISRLIGQPQLLYFVDSEIPQIGFQNNYGFVDDECRLITKNISSVEDVCFPKFFECSGEPTLVSVIKPNRLSQRSFEDVVRNLICKIYGISGSFMPTSINYKGQDIPIVPFETITESTIKTVDYDPILQPLACSHHNKDKLRFVIVTCYDGSRYATKAQTLDEGKTYQVPKALPKTQ
jgi:hypothetical protein